ncbi:hypothetical protein [Aeromonas caviae]|uniref:hypothetical protein n=1 Tax=Aeromonas caviae TaxID=648 RepID=UPI0038D09D42
MMRTECFIANLLKTPRLSRMSTGKSWLMAPLCRFILIRWGQQFPTLLMCAFNPVASQKWYHKRYHTRVSADTKYKQQVDFKQLYYLTLYSDPKHRVISLIDAPAPATRGLFYARFPQRSAA